jgi:hypothetical protein
MATNTTNYNLIKPAVNDPADQDLWGGYLNENFDTLDGLLKTASDTTVLTKTSNYTVTSSDRNSLIEVNATTGSLEITLPSAATLENGFVVSIKKIDSTTNTVTIDPVGSETIDGQTTVVLANQYDTINLVSNGVNWLILAKNIVQSVESNGRFLGIDKITTSQTWTKPTDVNSIHIFVCGAGGGGGSGASAGTSTTAVYDVTTLTGNGGDIAAVSSTVWRGGLGGVATGGNILNQTGGAGANEGADGTGGNGATGAGGSNRFASGGGAGLDGDLGGGGGGGSSSTAGGGAGGVAESYIQEAPEEITITIGTGGNGSGGSGGDGLVLIYKYS